MSENLETNTLDINNLPEQSQAQSGRVERAARLAAIAWNAGRMGIASVVMERMDHKDALINDRATQHLTGEKPVGGIEITTRLRRHEAGDPLIEQEHGEAIKAGGLPLKTGEFEAMPTANGRRATARSAVERALEASIDKRAQEKSKQDIYLARSIKIYGAMPQQTPAEHKTIARAVWGEEQSPAQVTPSKEGVVDRIRRRKYGAPEVPGVNQRYKKDRVSTIKHQKRQGKITATEARQETLRVKAETMKLGEDTARIMTKRQKRATRRMSKAINKPVAERVREFRRNRAVGVIKKAHQKIERHKAALGVVETFEEHRQAPALEYIRDVNPSVDTTQTTREQTAARNAHDRTVAEMTYGVSAVEVGNKTFTDQRHPEDILADLSASSKGVKKQKPKHDNPYEETKDIRSELQNMDVAEVQELWDLGEKLDAMLSLLPAEKWEETKKSVFEKFVSDKLTPAERKQGKGKLRDEDVQKFEKRLRILRHARATNK